MPENQSSGFPTSSDPNWPLQSQNKARSFKFQIYDEEELCYPCSDNKGADHNCTADLRAKLRFSHEATHYLTPFGMFDLY